MTSAAQDACINFKCSFHCTSIPKLFLRFLEDDMLAEFGGVFLVFDFALDELLVFARPIDLAGLFVLELNE